ncbi:DsbA family protein [Mycobacterium helveticum]|uniref:DsbA family protein n=1 Tax=Mycobacterium helveticum TaxID=2592811 RepID=A0A557XUT6_9MYCO|nr:DsbA family protein [Mycobacterium helveticum]TVS85815.1 DsbA family protein [Mycobacterium helveticum]TVS89758.1 DsbA family protein [Mycobacterium helveticum]
MADNSKRPPRFDMSSSGGKSGRLVQIGGTAFVVIFAVVLVAYIVTSHHKKDGNTGSGDTVRVTSSKLVTQPGTSNPKATVSFYEDFLCPACGNFERTFGPTVSKLIDIGAIEADYSMVSILDSPRNQDYPSRAGAAALCVADESISAFRRFHAALFSTDIQPSERGTSFPDNAKLIEIARESGVVGKVPDCINSGKYLSKVTGEAAAAHINATPTIKINGSDYDPSTPDALVAKIKTIVGDVPGIDTAVTPAAS